MRWLKKIYPFNKEQTVNIMSEFGPLVAMFVVNAAYGINAGTWALIVTTGMAIVAMLMVFLSVISTGGWHWRVREGFLPDSEPNSAGRGSELDLLP